MKEECSNCFEGKTEPVADDYPHEQIDALALARYKVVPSDQSMYWRHAVVAGDGQQHLYNGSEVDCQNMARKFAGAFLDGAFAFHSRYTSPVAAQGEQLDAKRWMAFNIGCIECGVSSAVIGLYDTKEEAEAVCAACAVELDWREGGKNDFSVFDLNAPQAEEYRVAIAALSKVRT